MDLGVRMQTPLFLQDVYEHFVKNGKMPEHEWNELVNDPEHTLSPTGQADNPASGCGCSAKNQTPSPGVAITSLPQYHDKVKQRKRDLNEHMDKLAELARDCNTIVEFSTRKESSIAFLAGLHEGGTLISYNDEHDPALAALTKSENTPSYLHKKLHSTDVDSIPDDTDMVFINERRHTYGEVSYCLDKFGVKARRYIVLHNTEIFREKDAVGQAGLLVAVRDWFKGHPEWSVIYHTTNQYGLTVLGCQPQDKPKKPGVLTLAKNFAHHLAEHAADGFKKVSKETYEHRLSICSICPLRADDSCSVCGCKLGDKAAWNSSECDLGYWQDDQFKPLKVTNDTGEDSRV
jgi:hypothetical protein